MKPDHRRSLYAASQPPAICAASRKLGMCGQANASSQGATPTMLVIDPILVTAYQDPLRCFTLLVNYSPAQNCLNEASGPVVLREPCGITFRKITCQPDKLSSSLAEPNTRIGRESHARGYQICRSKPVLPRQCVRRRQGAVSGRRSRGPQLDRKIHMMSLQEGRQQR